MQATCVYGNRHGTNPSRHADRLFRQTARLMVDELVQRLHDAGYSDITAAHHPLFEAIDPRARA